MSICPCMYPLIIIDGRYDDDIEYFAIPKEIIKDKDGGMTLPEIEIITTDDMKGVPREFVAVVWNELTHDNIKRYEVNEHIVIAGCDISSMIDKGGKLHCDEKKIYVVLHPMDEWLDHHVVDIRQSENSYSDTVNRLS